MKKGHYKYLDFMRVFFCIAILLYHLNIIEGGYLAVCSFFALSGYLSCISACKKEKFSLLSYYKNRFLKLYLPLITIVFITVAILSLWEEILWLNLKPETTSVLFGYNNFWQLSANLDYFARHINSPFMHLWYVAILLQFDILFPFLYTPLKKLGDKVHKIIPCMIMLVLAIIGSVYFYQTSMNQNIMIPYYSTFSRVFSLFFGCALGFIHFYYGALTPKFMNKQFVKRILFYFYIVVLGILFFKVDANSNYFQISMIITTLITCRLLDYGTTIQSEKTTFKDKIIKSFSSISYEIYLLQYPIIFVVQNIKLDETLKLPLIFISVFILSYVFHMIFTSKAKWKLSKYFLRILVICFTGFGIYQYVMAEDHTKEMKELEEQLAANQEVMKKKQEEYELNMKQEKEALEKALQELETDESKLDDIVTNLSIVGVGDSVMLGATPNLYDKFPNAYFDAAVSRTAWVINDILASRKASNQLGSTILINVGANGDCSDECKKEIIETIGERDIFWVNVTNDKDVNVNQKLVSLSKKYENVHVVDWASISKGHKEYFVADGIHLTEVGKVAYVNAIYDTIRNKYLEEYHQKKESLLETHEKEQQAKISFFGNDLLLNAFDEVQATFKEAKFMVNKEYKYETLKKEIETQIKKEELTSTIVFAFDQTMNFKKEEYQELVSLCKNKAIYMIAMDKQTKELLESFRFVNVTIVNFYQETLSHKEYMMPDKTHLTEKGNKALVEMLADIMQ